MLAWLIAAVVGAAAAGYQYGWPAGASWWGAVLRALAVAALVALCLNAPVGRGGHPRPYVALDVSASWRRAGGAAAYQAAVRDARGASSDSLFLVGDSLRPGAPPTQPADLHSRVRPAVERALAAGRPLVLVTDGEVDDPDALSDLPPGSRIEVEPRGAARDAGLTTLEAPRAAVAGDTIDVRATVVAGSAGAPAGRVLFAVGGRATGAAVAVDALPARGERTVAARLPVGATEGPREVRAIWSASGDAEPRNDTVSIVIDVSPAAGAVFVSTSPDEDARYALSVLRGALALPTRGFFRVAPGQWRADGTLAPVSDADVRKAVSAAPVVIVHGDTGIFGPPRRATRGSLGLIVPPSTPSDDEWYATGAPPSPLTAALAGVAWDSLAPVDVDATAPAGDWQGVEVRRARRFDRRVAVVGSTSAGRRVVVVSAGGLWRWHVRGGASADAYAAIWGAIFDWLAGERRDLRAAVLADALVREGDPIRWRRGTVTDSVVTVVMVRRGTTTPDSLRLRFPPGGGPVETPALPAGEYDVRTTGGAALLVVNPSREWLPRTAVLASGRVDGPVLAGTAPRLRGIGWVYVLLVATLCAEWIWRRRAGLR